MIGSRAASLIVLLLSSWARIAEATDYVRHDSSKVLIDGHTVFCALYDADRFGTHNVSGVSVSATVQLPDLTDVTAVVTSTYSGVDSLGRILGTAIIDLGPALQAAGVASFANLRVRCNVNDDRGFSETLYANNVAVIQAADYCALFPATAMPERDVLCYLQARTGNSKLGDYVRFEYLNADGRQDLRGWDDWESPMMKQLQRHTQLYASMLYYRDYYGITGTTPYAVWGAAWDLTDEGMPADPPVNLAAPAIVGDIYPLTVVSVEDGTQIYVHYIAAALAVELVKAVDWSLDDVEQGSGTWNLLFLSKYMMRRTNGSIPIPGYHPDVWNYPDGYLLTRDVLGGDGITYSHPSKILNLLFSSPALRYRNNQYEHTDGPLIAKIGEDGAASASQARLSTFYNILEWTTRFKHTDPGEEARQFYRGDSFAAYWGYLGSPWMTAMIDGTVYDPRGPDAANYGEWPFKQHFTGCWQTATFLKVVSQLVNIPTEVVLQQTNGHTGLHLAIDNLYLAHGDDLYQGGMDDYSGVPPSPASSVLIDKTLYWKSFPRGSEASAVLPVAIGVFESWIKSPSNAFTVTNYCLDLKTYGAAVDTAENLANGHVYSWLKRYTVAELQTRGLWTNLAQIVGSNGGCTAIGVKLDDDRAACDALQTATNEITRGCGDIPHLRELLY